jgi:hypothetical protein
MDKEFDATEVYTHLATTPPPAPHPESQIIRISTTNPRSRVLGSAGS